MSGIRVTYAGMISFVVGIASLFTGLIFTLIITRLLSQDDYGTWGLIGTLIGYSLMLRSLISYWSTREIARDVESGKTAFISTGFLSVIAVSIYLIIAYFFGSEIDVDQNVLFFAAILIPVEFIRTLLARITRGFRPQTEEYAVVFFEVTKIPVALFLIYYFDMGLSGVIITVFFATVASVIVLLIRTREKLRGEFNKKFVKKWTKLFWVPSYPNIAQIIYISDIAVFSIITGSVAGIAYWTAAISVSSISYLSAKIGKAVYPKLLAGGKKQYLEENMILVFYFSFPLAAISIVFAKPALFALNPLYEIAYSVVIFLVPMIFLRTTLAGLFSQALSGIEKVDTDQNATFMNYLKSKLFFLPTLENIQRAGYLATLVVVLLLLVPHIDSQIDLVVYWSIVALITQIPHTVYLYILARREFAPKFNYKILFKYLVTSISVFGIMHLLMDQFLVYENNIFEFLPNLLLYVVLGGGAYLGLTYLIDSNTRKLFKAILNEIKTLH